VLYCIPAVALLAALGISRIPLRLAVPIALVLAILVFPEQEAIRKPASRFDNLRELASLLKQHERPGDAIVFYHSLYRRVTAAYPAPYAELRDIMLQTPPAATHDLVGREFTDPAARLTGVERVWFVDNRATNLATEAPDALKNNLIRHSKHFKQAGKYKFRGGTLYLYVRR
jgi:mannosyltransferase